jgi:hypothetical protein
MTGGCGVDDRKPRVAEHDFSAPRDTLIIRATMPLRVIHPLNYIR